MEAFESFVAVALEAEGFVVSGPVKFPVALTVQKSAHTETQTHGFEVDVIGARADRLVLATVKSFFGSRGVAAEHVTATVGDTAAARLYRLLNDRVVRDTVVHGAARRFGYPLSQVELRFYVGKFAGPGKGKHEATIREWCASQHVGAGAIQVFDVHAVIKAVRGAAASKQYRDNPVLVAMKVLEAGGVLKIGLPDDIGADETGAASTLDE